MPTSTSSIVRKNFEGPYGLLESDTLVPRWTYPIVHGVVRKVEAWELHSLSNTSAPVRMVADIHVIHSNTYEETDDGLNLDAEAEASSKTESRLLIKPKLSKIRARWGKTDIGPENLFSVDETVVNATIDTIEHNAQKFRKHFLNGVFAPLLGYDIAAGEAEAIARDCLETDLEIDSEIVPYMERIGLANILGSLLKESKNIPRAVRADILKDWMVKAFDEVRAEHKTNKTSSKMLAQLRRLVHANDGMIAQPGAGIGSTRGFSEARKTRKENGEA